MDAFGNNAQSALIPHGSRFFTFFFTVLIKINFNKVHDTQCVLISGHSTVKLHSGSYNISHFVTNLLVIHYGSYS